jgi:DNA repair protein RadD
MITLRPYQQQALAAVYQHVRDRDDHPCIVLPTGAGKTPLIAAICRDTVLQWHGRAIVLAHVKELLTQSVDKLKATCPELSVGLYSAGLRKRDKTQPVIVAGIQSVYQKACDLGAFNFVIVDEAHLIPPDGEGRYQTFFKDAKVVNPEVRVLGLTATPYRMKTGPICTPEGILNHVCFEVGVKELIRDGYLSPLVSRAGLTLADTSELAVQGGEFVAREAEALMDQGDLVEAACAEIVAATHDRRCVLIFATGVDHGRHVVQVLLDQHQVECGFVVGETPSDERAKLIERFKSGTLKYLCNVNVLSTGFDATNVDCVVLLRPTMSPGLYSQMCGRGFRLHPGKRDCLVLDYGGNVLRHGPVDELRLARPTSANPGEPPAKECPSCHALIATGYARCPHCGHLFPPPQRSQHERQASREAILSQAVTTTDYEVLDVFYRVHRKRDAEAGAPPTMRVDYKIGLNEFVREWVCFEHSSYARLRAESWWKRRSPDPVPRTVKHAVDLANCGALAIPVKITVRQLAGEKFPTITDCELGPLPEAVPDPGVEVVEEPFATMPIALCFDGLEDEAVVPF